MFFYNSLVMTHTRGRNVSTGNNYRLHSVLFVTENVGIYIYRECYTNGMRWAWHVARMVEGRGGYKGLVGKPEGKSPLGRPGVDGRIILR